MANVSITGSSIFPTSITVEETGKTITLTDNTAVSKNIVVDQLTVTESPAALNDISDVNITSLTDNQILVYDSATSKWVNEDNAGGAGAVTSVNTQTGAVVLDTDDISEGTNKYYATSLFNTDFATKTTDNLTEGSTNLYYADSLVDAHLVGGTGVTYSAGNISIGQPVATTDDVTFNEVEAAEFIGTMRGPMLTKCSAGENLTKGDAVYISGISGNTPVVSKADADVSTKMPAIGLVSATTTSGNPCDVYTFGQLSNLNTTQNIGGTWTEGDSLYVSTTPGQLTKLKPSGETSAIQIVAKIEKVHASTGILLIQGAGRSNAVPNLNDGNIFIGNASNYATTSSLDTEVSALGYITASSTDTLTNKSGNISQWTNDAGYLTSETDSQTLSFSSPNLTISNGNTVDISAITTGYITASSTDTLTNKSGSNNQWTNDAGYITASSTDTLTNKSGNISQWTNDSGYLTGTLSGNLDLNDNYIYNSGTGDIGTVDFNDGIRLLGGANQRFQNTGATFHTVLSATNATANNNVIIPDASGTIMLNLADDTTPQLSATLDPNGNNINDSTRLYVIVGNNNAPSSGDYDSMSGATAGQRVRGPITIGESSGGTDRFHGNPRLNLYTMTADRNDGNARFRMNYVEGVLDTAGYDTTQTGFGRGHHGMFLSGKVRNSGASASSVGQVRAITMSPQIDGLTSNVTVSDMRACEVQPFIASGGTVTNMYGFHYSLSNSGTVTNQYSFYGAESAAPAYNAGGFTPGAFASTALPTGLPNGTIISISDNSYKPAYNASGTWKYVADDSNV